MRSRSCVLTIVALCAIAASHAARAGTLVVTNLDQPVAFADQIVPNDPAIGQFGFEPAQQFNTGPTATSLDRIFVNIGDYTAGTGSFQLAATLQADSSGIPGAVLDTFTFSVASIPTSGFTNVEFDPVSPFTLAANTNYWFVLAGSSSDGTGSVSWNWTFSTTTQGPGSLGLFTNSYDGGATWNGPYSGSPYLIQVNSVPEPAGWVLGGTGFAAILGLARWSRQRHRDAGPAS